MPEIQLSEYYVELVGFLLTLLVGLAIKDWATSFVKDGYTWRYVPNERIAMMKLAKVVDPELHADTAEEKAKKIEDLLKRE